jgi:hypothetical protein
MLEHADDDAAQKVDHHDAVAKGKQVHHVLQLELAAAVYLLRVIVIAVKSPPLPCSNSSGILTLSDRNMPELIIARSALSVRSAMSQKKLPIDVSRVRMCVNLASRSVSMMPTTCNNVHRTARGRAVIALLAGTRECA